MRIMREFQCPICGHYHEALVRDKDDYPMCPNKHGTMERIISTPSFHFVDGAGTNAGRAWAFHGRPLWGGMN
jgi:hypothetical protein